MLIIKLWNKFICQCFETKHKDLEANIAKFSRIRDIIIENRKTKARKEIEGDVSLSAFIYNSETVVTSKIKVYSRI